MTLTFSIFQNHRPAAWACVVSLFLLTLAAVLPAPAFWPHDDSRLLILHLLMELFSVIVSVLVVVVAWHAFTDDDRQIARTLIFGFSLVACADLVHGLSYPGMPDFFSPGSTSKAIFFWLLARTSELLTVALVLMRVRLPGARWQWVIAALGVFGVFFTLGTWHLDWFPATFVTGQGVTHFKASLEVVLSIGNLVAAMLFVRQGLTQKRNAREAYFAAACFVMALGELTFTTYFVTTDFLVIFGHLFKIVAYVLIYFGTFQLSLREPYVLLQKSEELLRNKQLELDAILQHVPAGVSRLDREGRFLYVNAPQARRFGKPISEIVGRSFEDIVPATHRADMSHQWALALTGHTMAYQWLGTDHQSELRQNSVLVAPERDGNGNIVGLMTVSIDTTDQFHLQNKLKDSLRNVSDLQSAIDAHAIVAITDAKGAITYVNEKFCEISQYSREELVGQNHRIINSGVHPPSFFVDLWRTIARGEVWSGEICNRAKDGSEYWVQSTLVPFLGASGKPERYISIRADITARKRMEMRMQQLAYHDTLTGLPNRRLLMDRLQQHMISATRSAQHGAVLFLDLDNFKEINDSLGHDQGDTLLCAVAQRLRSIVRQTDTVARLGGDEFVVLLPELGADAMKAITQAGWLAESVLQSLSQESCQLESSTIYISTSIGVVMFDDRHTSADEVIKQADLALYQAKDAGRNTIVFFDPKVQSEFEHRLALQIDLRQALAQEELCVYYQPIFDRDRKIVGMEALLRWHHPNLGMVSPIEFIPLAEKTGLIIPIGQWVIEQACQQLQQWADHPVRKHWRIAVNVSARQFRHPEFVHEVHVAMQRAGVRAGLLKLELTESSLQSNLQETIHKMEQLGRHGVHFAIDDFGTGYSSLAYLKEMPIHVLKLDRSFVKGVANNGKDLSIAKTILALAHNMGLDVVAEGVETETQYAVLLEMGCPFYQGYLFSQPLPLDVLDSQQIN